MSKSPASTRSLAALVVGNVLGGIGVASGIAVGALLVASMGGVELAGFGQALSVLGAALLAVPLANLAARRGRRRSLATGYAVAALGALIVLVGAWLGWFWLLLLGLLAFGSAQATNLQTRYAASELATPERRATIMSIVIWATTIGSVLGPNLSSVGAAVGRRIALPDLAGPYLFSLTGFVLAGLVIVLLFAARRAPLTGPEPGPAPAKPAKTVGALAALRWASHHPVARFAVLLIVVGHAVMVGIMSMTPVQLGHHGHGLQAVGLVISLHILGMYALSPLVGWLADRFGAMRTSLVGLILLGLSAVVILAAPSAFVSVTIALVLLGVGWSFTTISGSALLARVDAGEVRVPLQGATDALMNYGAATAALLGGPLLAWIGFGGLAIAAGALILPAAAVGWYARRHRDAAFAGSDQR
ncbi:MFS transporter [Granulicoccus sp. GXG6511]|uniref:MFS transporter n=1 Tax=Granulicoccus sp. GXG6511 TaxID=3381351 RepID=UPI003D7E4450